MAYVQERATVNQRVQIGAESVSALGTPVPANRSLQCFDFTFGAAANVQIFRPTGHKYTVATEENEEWTDGTLAGILDYNGAIYPLAGCMGNVGAVAHLASAVAKDWTFVPPIIGSLVPRTFTFEQGETATRAHRFSYGLFTEFGYKLTRKDVTASGKILGQSLTDGITMTASPTAIALAPVTGRHWNIYLDSTSAGLGTTQLLKVLSFEYMMTGIYGPAWFVNRANISWTAHTDLVPKATMKILLEADSNGMALLGYLQQSTTMYLRADAQGNVIDNLQTVILGVQTTGTFTLTYKGQTTTALAYNATSAAVQAALVALSTIGAGNVTVTGAAGGPYAVVLAGFLAQDLTVFTGNFTALTTPANASITQNQSYNKFTHDIAIKVIKPNFFKDDAGIFACEWELEVVEDPLWTASGQAQIFTVTNLLSAL